MAIPLCDASLTYCNWQHRDWMWGTGLLSCWCWSSRPMNHMGRLEKFYNGYPVQTVKKKCGWQKAETQVYIGPSWIFKISFQEQKNWKATASELAARLIVALHRLWEVMEGEPENEHRHLSELVCVDCLAYHWMDRVCLFRACSILFMYSFCGSILLCLHSTIFVRPASCMLCSLGNYLHSKSLLTFSSRNASVV